MFDRRALRSVGIIRRMVREAFWLSARGAPSTTRCCFVQAESLTSLLEAEASRRWSDGGYLLAIHRQRRLVRAAALAVEVELVQDHRLEQLHMST